jgi:outer membrane receptor for ferrienterochelin and colicins
LRSVFRLGNRFKLTLSGEVTAALKQSMRGGDDAEDPGTVVNVLQVEAPAQQIAGSFLVDWKLTDRLRVNAGVRTDFINLGGNSLAASEAIGKETFLAFSPRIALIAKPSATDVVKLFVGRSFRAPSTYEYYYDDGGLSQISVAAANSELRPETTNSAELEYTHRFDRVWSVLGSVHGLFAQDIIETTNVPDQPDVLFYRNSPVAQTSIGADIELRHELRAGVTASAFYGYLHGRYRSSPNAADTDLSQDLQLPNAPQHFAGGKVIFPISSGFTGALRAGFEDRRRAVPTLDAKSTRAVVADAVISGKSPRFGVHYAVGVYNLFNARYAQPAVPFPTLTMPQNGRSFIFSIGLTR